VPVDSTPFPPLTLALLAGAGLAAAGLFAFVRHRWTAPARRLEEMLAELSAGRVPRSFILPGPPAFIRIAGQVEKIAARQDRLLEQARREEYSLRAILRSMTEGVLVVDANHVVREVNEAFLRQFALRTNPIGRTVLEAVRIAAVEEAIVETFRSGQAHEREITLSPANPDEPPRHFDVSAMPVRRAGTEDVVAVFHDISRLKQLEDVRREFVANVSHELRTPLSIFRGYVETLIDQPHVPPAELQRILATMLRHSQRLNALVDDLLMLARLESRRIALDAVAVRLEPFLGRIAGDLKMKLADKQLTLVLALPEGLPPLEADPFRLEQVIYNLLDNAIKYSEPDGRITISAEVAGPMMRLHVTDHGKGIPPADLPHIFERFYRVDKARSRDQGGTGLGLSIVKHIVQLHGGEVAAESQLNHGTTITVALPLAEEEKEKEAPQNPTS